MSRLSIEIPDDLHRQVKAQASLQGLSMRDYVLKILGVSSAANSDPESGEVSAEPQASADAQRVEPESMRELLLNRPWQGSMTKAEIDAYIAEERASWNDD